MISIILTVLAYTIAAAFAGAGLGYAAEKFKVKDSPVAERIDKILPQIQCGQCGKIGCRQYAEAVAKGECAINLCRPGGPSTIKAIADIMGVSPDSVEGAAEPEKQLAYICEEKCIGCQKCQKACPVDAIVGAKGCINAVVSARCTGCELCLKTCPQECISMKKSPLLPEDWDFDYDSLRRE